MTGGERARPFVAVGFVVLVVGAACDLEESGLGGVADAQIDVLDAQLPLDSSAFDAPLDSSLDGGGTEAAAPPPPNSITGLEAWYRSDLGVTIDAGAIAWADQSGAGDSNRDLVQPVASKTPTFTASDPAFNNYASFSTTIGKSAWLATGVWNSPLAQPFTVFAVARATNPNGAWLFDTAGGNEVGLSTHGGAGNLHIFAGSFGLDMPAAANQTYSLIAIFDSASANSRLYVSSATSQAGASIGANAPSPVLIGDALGDTTGSFSGWTFAEIAFYQGALPTGSVSALNAYAAVRYGVTIGP